MTCPSPIQPADGKGPALMNRPSSMTADPRAMLCADTFRLPVRCRSAEVTESDARDDTSDGELRDREGARLQDSTDEIEERTKHDSPLASEPVAEPDAVDAAEEASSV